MYDWRCVHRKIFGPKREKIIAGWRKLHSEEFHDLYSSADMIPTYAM
jgi:hypothetical protein